MTIEGILRENRSFRGAQVISGHSGLAHEVRSIMVLEAADIENWGRRDQLLLSSFYALQELNEDDCRRFFEASARIGISGIVLKLGRLISEIPDFLRQNCENFNIPLITIPQDTRYEDLILSIMAPLMKAQADEQANLQKYNSLIHDLLSNHITGHVSLDQALQFLHLDNGSYYQLLMVQYPQFHASLADGKWDASDYFSLLQKYFSDRHLRFAYEQMHDRIFFIFNLQDPKSALRPDDLKPFFDSFQLVYEAALSNVDDRYHISQLHRQVLDTIWIGSLLYEKNFVLTFEELGIYRLFLRQDNMAQLAELITPTHLRLRKEDPSLWDTLETYVRTGMNYVKTGELLYLHPKTIKYRMDKLETMLNLDFTDSEVIFRIMLDSRLFRLIDHFQPAYLQKNS